MKSYEEEKNVTLFCKMKHRLLKEYKFPLFLCFCQVSKEVDPLLQSLHKSHWFAMPIPIVEMYCLWGHVWHRIRLKPT